MQRGVCMGNQQEPKKPRKKSMWMKGFVLSKPMTDMDYVEAHRRHLVTETTRLLWKSR